jgi:predicted AlkP superfamily phosphohydrolase/phosphomutase
MIDKIFLSFNDVDWSKTLAYSKGNFGQIYLNLKGREPRGVVTPETKDKIINDLISKLSEVRDDDGNKIFKRIYRKEELYFGRKIFLAPELILEPTDGYCSTRFFEFASNKIIGPHPRWSGSHRTEGVIFAIGPKIKKGYFIPSKSILDVAPTIIHLFNLNKPYYMDGRVMEDIFY